MMMKVSKWKSNKMKLKRKSSRKIKKITNSKEDENEVEWEEAGLGRARPSSRPKSPAGCWSA
eukprot:13728255-Heterocapsa_arctica.AAC.1